MTMLALALLGCTTPTPAGNQGSTQVPGVPTPTGPNDFTNVPWTLDPGPAPLTSLGDITWTPTATELFFAPADGSTVIIRSTEPDAGEPTVAPSPENPRVERTTYAREHHTEWYEDHGGRIKQGFDIPADVEAGPIELAFTVDSSLHGAADLDGSRLVFRNQAEAPVLTIDGLVAWDANGTELVSWMEYSCDPTCVWTLVVDDENAVYPVAIDPWIQGTLQRVTNNSSNQSYGISVSTADGWGAVGAPDAASGGKVEMFRHNGLTWVLAQTITPGSGSNRCGASVDVQEDRLVIGCPSGGTGSEGEARVYRYNGTTWVSEATLGYTAGATANLNLGTAVELSPDATRLCVSGTGGTAGRAMFFHRSGTTWTEAGSFVGNQTSSLFGLDCSIDGDRAIVGAPEQRLSGTDRGAVHTYERVASTWSASTILEVDDNSNHGRSLDLDGNQLAAWQYGSGGRVLIWEHDGTSWSNTDVLTATSPGAANGFGTDVDLDGDVLLAGEFRGDTFVTDSGAAYILERVDGVWAEQLTLAPTAAQGAVNGGRFGITVELDDGKAIIGMDPANPNANATEYAYFVNVTTCGAYTGQAGCDVDLRVTEVHGSPVNATTAGTFLELTNTGTDRVNLIGLQIETAAGTVTVTRNVSLSPGEVVAFAPSIAPGTDMPNLHSVYALPGLVLDAAGETIRLLDRDSVEFDSVITPALPTGASWQLAYGGDWTSNDWCATQKAGVDGDSTVDFFTVGAVNEPCARTFPFTYTYVRNTAADLTGSPSMTLEANGSMSTTNSGEGSWSVTSDAGGQALTVTYDSTNIVYLATKDFGESCFTGGSMDVSAAPPILDVASGSWVNDLCP